jgi:hypothetical protein
MRCAGRGGLACAVPLLLTLAACGLPDEDRTRSVDTAVPYRLLEPAVPSSDGQGADSSPPRRAPVVLWTRGDDKLVPASVDASCADAPSDVVDLVLRTLTESPTAEQRSAGWSSALPPSARLEVVEITNHVARVDVDLLALGDPERLPLAVGQLVLSVTSAPGVDALEIVASGQSVEAPLPRGALAGGPVTADDYAPLLPRRLRGMVSGDFGCPEP